MIRGWTRGQWVLRATMVLGPLVALLATALVGVPPRWWLVAVVATLALGFARFPESSVGTVAMAFVVIWWGVSLRDGLHAEALVAAAGMLASHVAGLVAAYGPDELPLDPAVLRRWALRAGAAFLLAPALWTLAVVLRGRPEPPGMWVTGLAAALAATLVATLAFTNEESD